MEKRDSSGERRRHKRFLPRENTYAVLTPGYTHLGIINNVSQGGLSYRYVSNGKSDNGGRHMDIFLTNRDFYLKQIPFTPVALTESDRRHAFSSVVMKHCSVRFGRLDFFQKDQLDFFLSQLTLEVRSVKDRRQDADTSYSGRERRIGRERRKSRLWN